jgi:hypothetical protein
MIQVLGIGAIATPVALVLRPLIMVWFACWYVKRTDDPDALAKVGTLMRK